ncbi:sigma-54-dependent Fis family transcriptional regulator [Aquabacterium sp. J223]|uniref:sigma-54 interaction domain-containing protein n=1 Tax=Aquabacterium sp. J223 TaxID=2898431 RepID=UPI0021AD8F8F|nr:sigma 54-interacting transcriptional regulator [Aquabacterium sp. J223]UUX97960.1 sigma 54-interacting transcriptional regulator [Aquabacterium sp. J223]
MFDVFARTAQGMLVVDRAHRVVWISEGYKRFLPALGFASEGDFVGRRVEDVVPNTLIPEVIETGQPMVVDLLTNQAGTFVVSRLPLRDAQGRVIGALGLVLLDESPGTAGRERSTLQPLASKFSRLQAELHDARRQLAAHRRPKYTIASFVGDSPAALEVKRQARRVAQGHSTVLLLGATGTGKEVLAQGIHAASPRAGRPFVAVNIAAVPESLLEAEFFGVAPGAYTGADRKGREGKFATADGGTLLLDEIGDMPMALQAKLLRVLQEQEFEPLGSNQVRRADVRIVAATSCDLPAMVAAGRFRADLYYRLNVLPIRLPRLADRLADLPALAEVLLDDIARRSGLPHKGLHPDALALLARHDWPGNIRELRNVLEQAVLMGDEPVLTAERLAQALPLAGEAPAAAPAARPPVADADGAASPPAAITPLPQAVADLEARAIRQALAATGGNKQAAARLLGIARATLYEKLALHPPEA